MTVNLLPKMLLLSIFLHYKVKKNQNMIKEPPSWTSRRLWTCLLSLSLRTTPIGFSHFFAHFLLPLEEKTNLLKSALNLASNKPLFCCLSVLVFYCGANQYSETACIFSKFLKNRLKGFWGLKGFYWSK